MTGKVPVAPRLKAAPGATTQLSRPTWISADTTTSFARKAADQTSIRFAATAETRLGGYLVRMETTPDAQPALAMFWDLAIADYLAEGEQSVQSLVAEVNPGGVGPLEDRTDSALESLLMAGGAVALWGTWEVRSRVRGSSRKPIGLKKP